MQKFSELRAKEVIDIIDGKRLGNVCDCEIDTENGKITAIMVPNKCGSLFRREDYTIPWRHIKKIGDDIILVHLNLRCP